MSISEAEVRLAYLLLLGREPESQAVVEAKSRGLTSLTELRKELLKSEEFLSLNLLGADPFSAHYLKGPSKIEVNVTSDVMSKLVNRVRSQWTRLGERDPYWSVLSDEQYRTRNLTAKNLDDFHATGRANADLIDIFSARSGVSVSRGTCLELGCGVGRITRYLAEKFEQVIAVDVSPGNLKICSDYLTDLGIRNVDTRLIHQPGDLLSFDEFDFFYSLIVLQHNAPPVQKMILEILLKKISPGGGCLFQALDSIQNYEFDAARFLASEGEEFDTHCLPRPLVISLVQQIGLLLRDVVPDPFLGPSLGSYTYFATSP